MKLAPAAPTPLTQLMRSLVTATVVALAAGAVVAFGGRFGSHRAAGAEVVHLVGVDGVRCPPAGRSGPALGRLPQPAAAALNRLGTLEATPYDGAANDHVHALESSTADLALDPATARQLRGELRSAARAACGLQTTGQAEHAGYYLGSPYVDGVGTHWVNWSVIDEPFQVTRPSMLLFGQVGDREQLVGFSYWVRSRQPPAGFIGSADIWHRHTGLCIRDDGQWADENVTAAECRGTWLNGSDLWMLHAWIVPDHPDSLGVFAPINRTLCRASTPEIGRCAGREIRG